MLRLPYAEAVETVGVSLLVSVDAGADACAPVLVDALARVVVARDVVVDALLRDVFVRDAALDVLLRGVFVFSDADCAASSGEATVFAVVFCAVFAVVFLEDDAA